MTDVIKINNLSAVADFSQYHKYSINELTEIISTIEVKAFYMKGILLKYIKENNRYEELGFKSFDEYYTQVLNYKKAYAYQLLSAVDVYDNLSAVADFLPTAEKQLRPLTSLDKNAQIDVWKTVAKDKVPTAKEVQEAVNKRKNKEPKKSDKKVDKIDNTQLNATLDRLDIVEEENKSLHSIITKQTNTIKVLEAKLIKAHEEIESLRYTIKSQEPYIFKCMELNIQIDLPVEEEQILLTRTEIVETIEQYGEGFQPMILKKDKTTNLELFNVLVAIRNRFEENKSIIPNPLSERVRLAVGPEPEEDIGTLKSLPRSNIKA